MELKARDLKCRGVLGFVAPPQHGCYKFWGTLAERSHKREAFRERYQIAAPTLMCIAVALARAASLGVFPTGESDAAPTSGGWSSKHETSYAEECWDLWRFFKSE